MTRHTPTELRAKADRFDWTGQETASMLRQAADDAEDAERYRWLKQQRIVRAHPMRALFAGETRILANSTIEFTGDYTYIVKGSISDLDNAIDAARKETT